MTLAELAADQAELEVNIARPITARGRGDWEYILWAGDVVLTGQGATGSGPAPSNPTRDE